MVSAVGLAMLLCSTCGSDNPGEACFCHACGSRVVATPVPALAARDEAPGLDDDEMAFLGGMAASRRRRVGMAIGLVAAACAVPLTLRASMRGPSSGARAEAPVLKPAPAEPAVAAPEATLEVQARPVAPVVAKAAPAVPAAPEAPALAAGALPPPAAHAPADVFPSGHRHGYRRHHHEARPALEADAGEAEAAPAGISGARAATAAVRAVVRQHEDEAYDCYESAFGGAHRGRTRLAVRFILGADGQARSLGVTANDSGSEDLATCLTSRVGEWTFPGSAGDVTVTHAFVFAAQ